MCQVLMIKRLNHTRSSNGSTRMNPSEAMKQSIEQTLYQRSSLHGKIGRELTNTITNNTKSNQMNGAFDYSEYKQMMRRKYLKTSKFSQNCVINSSKTATKTNGNINFNTINKINKINKMNKNTTIKLLTMNKQRFLPVRQFDTIANNFYVNSTHYNSHQQVLGLLAPPNTNNKIKIKTMNRIFNYLRGLKSYFWLESCMKGINVLFKSKPLLFGAMFATIKSFIADAFAQTVIEGNDFNDINIKRNILFGFVGLFWGGFVHYGVYAKLYPKMFGFMKQWHWSMRSSLQSIFDNSVHAMFFYLPFFYCVKTCIYDGFNLGNCENALKIWSENFWTDYKAILSVWFPANVATFLMPQHLRVPWLAMVSFLWTVILSCLRGSNNNDNETMTDGNEIIEIGIEMPQFDSGGGGAAAAVVSNGQVSF